jgi:hypothetical protein
MHIPSIVWFALVSPFILLKPDKRIKLVHMYVCIYERYWSSVKFRYHLRATQSAYNKEKGIHRHLALLDQMPRYSTRYIYSNTCFSGTEWHDWWKDCSALASCTAPVVRLSVYLFLPFSRQFSIYLYILLYNCGHTNKATNAIISATLYMWIII